MYRIYVVPNKDLSGSCVGVVYDNEQNYFHVVGCRKGPNFKYDSKQDITTIELDDDFIEVCPDDGILPFKESRQIRINDAYMSPGSRILDEISTINFDTSKEKFLKYFDLKD